MTNPSVTTETAYQRQGREQRERQEARARREADRAKLIRKSRRWANRLASDASRAADRIDGYSRDDLGLNHD